MRVRNVLMFFGAILGALLPEVTAALDYTIELVDGVLDPVPDAYERLVVSLFGAVLVALILKPLQTFTTPATDPRTSDGVQLIPVTVLEPPVVDQHAAVFDVSPDDDYEDEDPDALDLV